MTFSSMEMNSTFEAQHSVVVQKESSKDLNSGPTAPSYPNNIVLQDQNSI